MFRVARILPVVVVAPQPWFPFQGLIRRIRPHFRPMAPAAEVQDGVRVLRPRFLSLPGTLKWLDGWMMAVCCYGLLRRLRREFDFDLIDAHFAHPEGYAASLLGRWLKVPVTITLRGTEVPLSRDPARRHRILAALDAAHKVFAVSDSLRRHVGALGADVRKILVVGNGVDTEVFQPEDRDEARARLGIPQDAKVLISVGAMVERKGFHRVIECLPDLQRKWPGLRFLIVGAAGPEGDMRRDLECLTASLVLEQAVHFLGELPSNELRWPLSAADVFVLATRNEGWANVLLEAMACGLPVVATDVGGNSEVVCHSGLGHIVPFGDRHALTHALARALERTWDRQEIIGYAQQNAWDGRVETLVGEFVHIVETNRDHPLMPAPRWS
jgi:glycosyltransferase involved in cell wall biosynthesis